MHQLSAAVIRGKLASPIQHHHRPRFTHVLLYITFTFAKIE